MLFRPPLSLALASAGSATKAILKILSKARGPVKGLFISSCNCGFLGKVGFSQAYFRCIKSHPKQLWLTHQAATDGSAKEPWAVGSSNLILASLNKT